MRIVKGTTESFDTYSVLLITELSKPWWYPQFLWSKKTIETEVPLVLEADDTSGYLMRQLTTENGKPIYTGKLGDIVMTNTVKVLMLVPSIRDAVVLSGFGPKVISTYERGLKIINKNPTVSISMQIKESNETEALPVVE